MANLVKLDLRRRQLGMSRAALARRSGVSIPTVQRILTGKEIAPSVATVDALAAALGLAVQIVEVVEADELRQRQATKKAARLGGMVQGTMALESQAVDRQTLDSITQRNVHRLLAASGRKLWDE